MAFDRQGAGQLPERRLERRPEGEVGRRGPALRHMDRRRRDLGKPVGDLQRQIGFRRAGQGDPHGYRHRLPFAGDYRAFGEFDLHSGGDEGDRHLRGLSQAVDAKRGGVGGRREVRRRRAIHDPSHHQARLHGQRLLIARAGEFHEAQCKTILLGPQRRRELLKLFVRQALEDLLGRDDLTELEHRCVPVERRHDFSRGQSALNYEFAVRCFAMVRCFVRFS